MNLTMRGVSMEIDDAVIVEMVRQRLVGSTYPDNLKLTAAPRIGVEWAGQNGIYAGMARGLNAEADYPLIVGEYLKPMKWKDLIDYAKTVGNGWRVPYKRESALCFANVPELFEKEWHWTCEQYEADSVCAWARHFSNGVQFLYLKGDEFRCRLVRSVIVF